MLSVEITLTAWGGWRRKGRRKGRALILIFPLVKAAAGAYMPVGVGTITGWLVTPIRARGHLAALILVISRAPLVLILARVVAVWPIVESPRGPTW